MHFICVGTPQLPESLGADLSQVDGAIELLGPHLTRPTVVVGKSTVPVGTAPRLAARLAELAPAGAGAELVWNPEFLREGFAVEDTLRPNRLVIGGASGARGEGAARGVRRRAEPRRPARGHRLRHRRAGQGLGQRLPGHQDLLHQRGRRDVRGDRRGRRRPRRRARSRRPDRPQVPQRGHRVRRWLPAQGHPGVPAPRGRARRRRHDDVPAPHRRDQPEPARARRQHRHLDARRLPRRRPDRGVGSGVQARQRRRTRLPRPLDRGSAAPARRPGEHLRPEGRRRPRWRCSPR